MEPSRLLLWRLIAVAGTGLMCVRPALAAPSRLAPEVGYNHSEQETPRSAAMGGALRALSNSTEAIFLNPANLAATRVYHLAAIGQFWPQASRQSYGGAAVDSIVNRQGLAGGVAGTWTRQDADGVDRKSFDLRFALAAPLSDVFLLGAGMRYLALSQDGYPGTDAGLAPSLASAGLPEGDIVKDITFDVGLTLRPIPEFVISAVGANLTDPGHGFLPLTFGGGAAIGANAFSIEADVVGDFTTYDETTIRAMGGAEVLVAESIALRGGYRYDEGFDSHSLSGGLGYLANEFDLDGALRVPVAGPRAFAFMIGFRYHLDGAGLVAP